MKTPALSASTGRCATRRPNVVPADKPAPAGPAIIATDRAHDKAIYPERAVVYRLPP